MFSEDLVEKEKGSFPVFGFGGVGSRLYRPEIDLHRHKDPSSRISTQYFLGQSKTVSEQTRLGSTNPNMYWLYLVNSSVWWLDLVSLWTTNQLSVQLYQN